PARSVPGLRPGSVAEGSTCAGVAAGAWAGAAACAGPGEAEGEIDGTGTSPGKSSMSAPIVSRIRKRALQKGHVVGRPTESAGRRKPFPHLGQAVLIMPSSRGSLPGMEGSVEGARGKGAGAEGTVEGG